MAATPSSRPIAYRVQPRLMRGTAAELNANARERLLDVDGVPVPADQVLEPLAAVEIPEGLVLTTRPGETGGELAKRAEYLGMALRGGYLMLAGRRRKFSAWGRARVVELLTQHDYMAAVADVAYALATEADVRADAAAATLESLLADLDEDDPLDHRELDRIGEARRAAEAAAWERSPAAVAGP